MSEHYANPMLLLSLVLLACATPTRSSVSLPLRRRRGGAATSRQRRLSTELAPEGGVDLGYVYAEISLNEQSFNVILDTGSPMTIVPCNDCAGCGAGKHRFTPTAPLGRQFSLSYLEGSTLRGKMTSATLGVDGHHASFTFGCAHRMTRLFQEQWADGICGLNESPQSLVQVMRAHHQLEHNTFAIDLREAASPALRIGVAPDRNRSWVPMEHKRVSYVVRGSSLRIGDQVLVGATEWLVDSGSTFIYVGSNHMGAIRRTLGRGCRDQPWTQTLTLDLGSGVAMTLTPEQYSYSENGRYCLGIYPGAPATIGLIAMEHRETQFDLGNQLISFD